MRRDHRLRTEHRAGEAAQLLEPMREQSLVPEVSSYSATMSVCEKDWRIVGPDRLIDTRPANRRTLYVLTVLFGVCSPVSQVRFPMRTSDTAKHTSDMAVSKASAHVSHTPTFGLRSGTQGGPVQPQLFARML